MIKKGAMRKTQIKPAGNRQPKFYYIAGMKTISILSSFLFLFIVACNNSGEETAPAAENDIDAARTFIRAALDGDYMKGRLMLLSDSTNYQYYDEYEKAHKKLSDLEKLQYREASINVHNVTPINDSTTIFIYSNSYKKDRDTLKLIKISGKWEVDLKYLFNHAMDTLLPSLIKKDSLP